MRYVLVFLSLMLALLAFAKSQWHYTGTIEKYAVQMDLKLDGTKIGGFYYYESSGQLLWLDGTLDSSGAAVMKEKTDVLTGDNARTGFGDGPVTGSFSGHFTADRKSFSGTWISADEKRLLSFKLTAVVKYVMTAHTVKVGAVKIPLTAIVPHFLAGGVFHQLEAHCEKEAKAFDHQCLEACPEWYPSKEEDDYMPIFGNDYIVEVIYYSPDLVSLKVHNYLQTGGNHPNGDETGLIYLLNNNAWRSLSWKSLLMSSDDHRKALTDYLLHDLERQGAMINNLVNKDPFIKKTSIFFTPGSVTFIYPREIIGSYADAEYYVNIPFKVISADLAQQGSLYPYIRLK